VIAIISRPTLSGRIKEHIVHYNIEDKDRARRLEALRTADGTDLSDEIALSRLLAEESVNSGRAALASQILHNIGKIELTQIAMREKAAQLLDRHAIVAMARLICANIVARLSGRPDFAELVDLIIPAIEEAVMTATPPQTEQRLLTQEKPE
jgi:hypothetical protein